MIAKEDNELRGGRSRLYTRATLSRWLPWPVHVDKIYGWGTFCIDADPETGQGSLEDSIVVYFNIYGSLKSSTFPCTKHVSTLRDKWDMHEKCKKLAQSQRRLKLSATGTVHLAETGKDIPLCRHLSHGHINTMARRLDIARCGIQLKIQRYSTRPIELNSANANTGCVRFQSKVPLCLHTYSAASEEQRPKGD